MFDGHYDTDGSDDVIGGDRLIIATVVFFLVFVLYCRMSIKPQHDSAIIKLEVNTL